MPQLIFDITSFQRRFAKLASGIFLEQVKFGVWSENRSAAMASDHAPFRATLLQKQYNLLVMLIASSASNVGFAMFDTSSNWLMTSLNPDPMMVSAVQVATTLPMFLLTLPAGALTDIIDARRLLIGAQLAVTGISVVIAAVVTLHMATPAVL